MLNRTNEDLIKELTDLGYLKSERVIEAFQKIDRKDFLPKGYDSRAYLNTALLIGHGQTISQPLVVAFMLELLDLRPGDNVLEIGSGSGWLTCLIAQLISNQLINADKEIGLINTDNKINENRNNNQQGAGGIVSLEIVSELKEIAEQNISRHFNIGVNQSLVQGESVSILAVLGDGSKGYPEKSPYDKIIASASGEDIPKEWKEQLSIGGRIVAPIKNSIVVLEKTEKNEFEKREYYGFSFVPLIRE